MTPGTGADGNGDGTVNGSDLLIYQSNSGSGPNLDFLHGYDGGENDK